MANILLDGGNEYDFMSQYRWRPFPLPWWCHTVMRSSPNPWENHNEHTTTMKTPSEAGGGKDLDNNTCLYTLDNVCVHSAPGLDESPVLYLHDSSVSVGALT